MKKVWVFLSYQCFFCIACIFANAQSFVSIATGISRDINNTKGTFYHVPLSVQWKPSSNPRGSFFIEMDGGIPFTEKRSGNAYTLNPSLAQEMTLEETIRSYLFSLSIGFRIYLLGDKKSNRIYLNLLPIGFAAQNFIINYKNYDNKNYEILNPDVNLARTGIVAGFAAVWDFPNQCMLRLHLQSPLIADKGGYPLSYRFVAPLQLSFGYRFNGHKPK